MDEIHHTLKLLHRSSQSAAKTFFDFLDQVTKDNDIRNHVHIRKVASTIWSLILRSDGHLEEVMVT